MAACTTPAATTSTVDGSTRSQRPVARCRPRAPAGPSVRSVTARDRIRLRASLRRDVLVDVEEVPGVVAPLHVDESPVLHRPEDAAGVETAVRSEEHTTELQSRQYLVCSLL